PRPGPPSRTRPVPAAARWVFLLIGFSSTAYYRDGGRRGGRVGDAPGQAGSAGGAARRGHYYDRRRTASPTRPGHSVGTPGSRPVHHPDRQPLLADGARQPLGLPGNRRRHRRRRGGGGGRGHGPAPDQDGARHRG